MLGIKNLASKKFQQSSFYFKQRSFHLSSFYLANNYFINPASN